jgi:uncharacterized protein (TIGR03435 family)
MERVRIGGLLLSIFFPLALAGQSARPAASAASPATASTAAAGAGTAAAGAAATGATASGTAAGVTPSSKAAADAKPAVFVVADVHPSPGSFMGNYFHISPFTGDRYVVHQATLLDLITTTYKVEADAVTGGPPGLEFDHYDIVAQVPPGSTEDSRRQMLKSLLVNRFALVAETKMTPLPSFLLKAGKDAPKMKPTADATGHSGCEYHPPSPPPPPGTPFPTTITLQCSNMTMEQFAEELRGMGWAYLNHPVVDSTGMKGAWDFDFRFSWQRGAEGGLTIFEAVEKLGLKLEAGTAPRQALVITSMADGPTANVAGIEKMLPPEPMPSFEVATVRPSKNESKEAQVRFQSVDHVTFSGSERRLISLAWDISEKTIFDAPAYMDDKVWEITAKIPVPDTPLAPVARPQIDFDQVRLMLQSLLEERFGLKVHAEQRPGNGYTLLTGTPKMKKGDPTKRASCTGRVAPGEKDPRVANPYATQYMHCENVTMDQFARELKDYSGGIIKTPVLNETGMQGRYDLTLSFTGLTQLERLGLAQGGYTPKGSAGPAPSADKGDSGSTGTAAGDPGGVPVMMTDAVAKQLGLKLELVKRPIPALVVDHMEEMPTDN